MLGFIERSAGYTDESAIVLGRSSATAFRDAGTDSISGPYNLLTHGISSEMLPLHNNVPNLVSQFLRKLIDLEILEMGFRHL